MLILMYLLHGEYYMYWLPCSFSGHNILMRILFVLVSYISLLGCALLDGCVMSFFFCSLLQRPLHSGGLGAEELLDRFHVCACADG